MPFQLHLKKYHVLETEFEDFFFKARICALLWPQETNCISRRCHAMPYHQDCSLLLATNLKPQRFYPSLATACSLLTLFRLPWDFLTNPSYLIPNFTSFWFLGEKHSLCTNFTYIVIHTNNNILIFNMKN